MKKALGTFLFVCFFSFIQGQPGPEALYGQYHSAKTIDEKGDILTAYFKSEAKGPVAERITAVIKTIDYFKTKADKWGTGYLQLAIASSYRITGQYSSSLKYSLPALKNFEETNDTSAIISALLQIGSSFTASQNIQQGLNYYKKCKPYTEALLDKNTYVIVLNKIADCYNKLNFPDSALVVIQKPVKIAEENNDSLILVDFYQMTGNAWLEKDDPQKSRTYLFKSLDYASSRDVYNTNSHTTNGYYASINCDLAAAFFRSGIYDTAIIFAAHAVEYAYPEYRKELMTAYQWQYKSYEQLHLPDSVNKYYRMSMDIKDSIFTSEKNSNIILMDFQEQTRQEEIAAKKIKDAAERKENMEYALISLGIVAGVGLFLLLSRRFVIHIKVIKAFGVVILLIVFEFFNLLLHPLLEMITHHSVFLMLAALVILAAILAPLHHKAEKWATAKLLEKNNEVALREAKKTTK